MSQESIIDVSRVHRQAGSMMSIDVDVSGVTGLGVAMARVPDGSSVHLEMTLESVTEGIWVTGTADVPVEAECSRCLDPLHWEEEVAFEQLFRYPATDARGLHLESGNLDVDDDMPEIVDETIDVEGPLRDAVVLSLPLAPLCDLDCSGICATCGERLDSPHDHPSADPRWSALADLLDPTRLGEGSA